MDVPMRYHDGPGPLSPEGAVQYLGTHLQSATEAGNLAHLPGYLTRGGLIAPVVMDADLWQMVGWDGHGIPPDRLIRNLCQGCNLEGDRLTGSRSLFQAPLEIVIPFPSELSEAMHSDPEAARATLRKALDTTISELERAAVRKRSGKGRKAQPDWAPARVLALGYLHAENRAKENHLHAHCEIFRPALDEEGKWRTLDNGRHVSRFSIPGGVRELVTTAIVMEAARWGYRVEILPGKAKGPGPHGARVTSPDGHVFERGSVRRERRLTILAAQAMVKACGATPLTPKEVELVRKETGRFPHELKGIRLMAHLEKKLSALGFLDDSGRIGESRQVMAALSKMEEAMAEAQVFLVDVPMSRADESAQIVKSKRQALVAQVPELRANTHQARIRWTGAYDSLLELVATHPEGLRTDNLNKNSRDNLSKLKRAGILLGEKVGGRMTYRLGLPGEERLARSRDEQKEAEKSVLKMVHLSMAGASSPSQVRGRLEAIGIQTNPKEGRFELGAAGRTVREPDLIALTGIRPMTPVSPDLPWWESWWARRHELPTILARAILRPAEVLARWGESLGQQAAEVIAVRVRDLKGRRASETAARRTAAVDRDQPGAITRQQDRIPTVPVGGPSHGRRI